MPCHLHDLHDLDALLRRFLQRRHLRIRYPDRNGDAIDALADGRVDQAHQVGAEVVVVRHGHVSDLATIRLDYQGRIINALLHDVEEGVLRRTRGTDPVNGLSARIHLPDHAFRLVPLAQSGDLHALEQCGLTAPGFKTRIFNFVHFLVLFDLAVWDHSGRLRRRHHRD